ncbi:MAG: glycosyltransferase family 2 protein [Patescibacteria group bacterium]
MDLSIVIVSWNTKQLLDDCLASIFKETKEINFEVFVVDNKSSDGSAAMVKDKYPKVNLIENKINAGFAAANNQAIRQASGRYILALNPDTVVLKNALDGAVKILDKRPEVAILGPKTLNSDGSQQKTVWADPSLAAQIFLLTKLKHLFPKLKTIKKYYRFSFDYNKESYVEQVQGSFLLIRREFLEKRGLFDEKFFIWFEEVDLCLRARKAGYKILYSPETQIIHYGGESFKQVMTLKKQKMYNRSLFYYFWKNKPRWQYFVLRVFEIPSLLLAALAGTIKSLK